MLGLTNSGKSTLVHYLSTKQVTKPYATHIPSYEHVSILGDSYVIFDLSGNSTEREIYKDYLIPNLSAIFFMIDASSLLHVAEFKKSDTGFFAEVFDNFHSVFSSISSTFSGTGPHILIIFSHVDKFEKETGAKFSLTEAIEQLQVYEACERENMDIRALQFGSLKIDEYEENVNKIMKKFSAVMQQRKSVKQKCIDWMYKHETIVKWVIIGMLLLIVLLLVQRNAKFLN